MNEEERMDTPEGAGTRSELSDNSVMSPAPASGHDTESAEDSGHVPAAAPSGAEPARIIEALLFAADEPLGIGRITQVAGLEPDAIIAAVDELNDIYSASGRTFRIHKVAQGYQLYTTADYADWVRKLYQSQQVQKLSRAALEVLAIAAYNQPITRPEIEKLRGVDCSGPLLTLLERRLIATAGRAHRAGNPFLYRTTREFLRYFGLEKLEDLPSIEELGEFLADRETILDGDASERRVQQQTFESLAVDYSRRAQGAEADLPQDTEPEASEAEGTRSEAESSGHDPKSSEDLGHVPADADGVAPTEENQ